MDNLVTACFDCNRGKRDKILKELTSDIPPPTGDAMKSLKDTCIKAIHDAEDLDVRMVLHDAIIKVWTGLTKRDGVHMGTFKVVFGYVDEYGFELVAMWIALAYRRCRSSDERMGRYISGCRSAALALWHRTGAGNRDFIPVRGLFDLGLFQQWEVQHASTR